MSCRSRRITASRSSGDSLRRASWTSFWASWLRTRASGPAEPSSSLSRQGQPVILIAGGRVQRVRDPVVLSLTKVVHQQISSDRGNPCHERGPCGVERAERAIHLDKYFLGQVGRIVGRAGKAIADVIDAAMILLNDFLPCRSVAGNTATDKGIDGLDIVQSALPRGVTSGPILLTAKDLYEKARPEVRCEQAPCRPVLAFGQKLRSVRMVFACIVAGREESLMSRTWRRRIRCPGASPTNPCSDAVRVPNWHQLHLSGT